MKKLFIIIMAAIIMIFTAACKNNISLENAAVKYFAEFPGSRIVTWTDVIDKIDSGDEPFIVSLQKEDAYAKTHIKGAYNASWGEDLAEKLTLFPKGTPVYLYSDTGQISGQAVALLCMLGIEAYSVKSGFENGQAEAAGFEAYLEKTKNEFPEGRTKYNKETLEFVKSYLLSASDYGNFIIQSSYVSPLISSGEVAVMDIRSEDDFNKVHIKGAINVPFSSGIHDKFSDFADKKVLVVCYSGQTAGQSVAIMRAMGYDAISLESGMAGWTDYIKLSAVKEYFAPGFENPMITWDALFEKIDAGEKPFIVSLRSREDYSAGHIKGAYLTEWGADLADKLSLFPTESPVYVYCYSGQRAGQATALMRMLGIDAYSVKSGLNNDTASSEGFDGYLTIESAEMPNGNAEFDMAMLFEVKEYFISAGMEGNNSFIISGEDALAETKAGNAAVVDIRKAQDFTAGYVESSVNIPFGEGMNDWFAKLPAGKLIIAGTVEQTAGQTTAVLRLLGYDAVMLDEGINEGWIAKGYPIVKEQTD